MLRRLPLASLVLLVAACSSGASSPAYVPPPASTVVDDPGPVKIRREIVLIPGVVPPPNPAGGQGTPPEQNQVRLVRYRVDADPPKPARAIVVMMPGFLGGAGSVDALARAVVRRSTADDVLEAWAIDRRSNLLEDTRGLDVAEAKKDPSIAPRYYFDAETVEGKSFDGFLAGAAMPWVSEWGLATTLGDLRAVIARVPENDRPARVVLLGHSLGASIVEEYAAWDFDGAPGYRDLAGLVLLDGVAGNEGAAPASVDRNTYENGGSSSSAIFKQLGVVSDIRAGNVFFTLPFLGVKAYVVSEYTAMRSHWSPQAIDADDERDGLLGILLGVSPVPKMTNRAAMGLAFDEKSSPFGFIAVSCGEPAGGPMGEYATVLGTMASHPTDPNATYTWVDFDQAMPAEATSIDDFARAWYEGPQLNLAEWYFPQRLPVDAEAAGTLNVTDDDWRAQTYGLRAKHGAEIDVPVYAMALALEQKASVFDAFKALLAPVGAGRPSAGKTRDDPDAFTAQAMPDLQHLDGVSGADVAGSHVAAWYDALVAFAKKQTPAGGVVVP